MVVRVAGSVLGVWQDAHGLDDWMRLAGGGVRTGARQ